MKRLILVLGGSLVACASHGTPSELPAPNANATAPTTPTPKPPPPVDAVALGIGLPLAIEDDAELSPGAPNIVLRGTLLLVDSEPAGDVTEVVTSQRLARLDGLFSVLTARRGERHEGVATLWCDRATSLLVFKSVFQTAAFAGYPSFRLAVVGAESGRIGYQAFGARVPGPARAQNADPRDPFALHLDVFGEGRAQLVWKVGSRVEDTIDVTRSELAKQLAVQWQTRGGHRGQADRGFDQLVMHVPNALTLNDAVRLLDAAYFPRREYSADGNVLRVPAFDVTFAVN
jgi:hypothetical protein